MSLLTKASLIATPTAYGDGVLNSVKPVSRENLLLQSNSFDTTWVNFSSTETSGQTGYDGSSDAWLLQITAASGSIRQTISSTGVQTYSFYAKKGTTDWVAAYVQTTSSIPYCFFDLTNGVKGATQNNVIDSSITSVGSGWYRISVVFNATTTDVRIFPAEANAVLASQISDNIYIQDSQLQKGITATQYVETTTEAVQNGDFSFSRASAATRVNEQGLIEKERGNLLLQSNSFDTTWVNSNTTLTSGQSGYDGSNDAWLLNKTASAANIQLSVSTSGVNTFSYYAKAGSVDWTRLLILGSTNASTYINLTNGAIGAGGGGFIDATATDVGSGWYRVSITHSTAITQVRIYPAPADNDTSGTSGNIYIQDAQLEQGLVATDYIETTTAAVYEGITDNIPIINYENGIGSFLLEGQRTNVLQNSEYFSGSYWINNGVTITDNAAISPEGKTNAALLTGVSGGFGIVRFSTWTATNKVASCFAKAGSGNIFKIANVSAGNRYVLFDLSDGTISEESASWSGSIEDYGNGWYRCTAISNNETGTFSLGTTAASDSVYIYGAQLEAGHLTSYIPTYGTSVTRVGETCNNAGNSSLFNDSEGVLFTEIAALADDGTTKTINLVNSSNSDNRLSLNYRTELGRIQMFLNYTGATATNISVYNVDKTNYNKIACKYKNNDMALWVNGFEVATSNTGTTSSNIGFSNIEFSRTGNDFFYGKTKMVSTFTEALSDSELECLTSWSSFNRMATAQNYTIQ